MWATGSTVQAMSYDTAQSIKVERDSHWFYMKVNIVKTDKYYIPRVMFSFNMNQLFCSPPCDKQGSIFSVT